MVQGTFPSRVFGSMGLALGTVSSEICLVLRGFWLPVVPRQTCLPLPSWGGGGRAASLCAREGRAKRLGVDEGKCKTRNATLATEREWWRETKSPCHKLARHHVPGAPVTPASSSTWPVGWRELRSWPHPYAVVGNHSGRLCQLPG